MAGHGGAGRGKAGHGRAGLGEAGQGKARQGEVFHNHQPRTSPVNDTDTDIIELCPGYDQAEPVGDTIELSPDPAPPTFAERLEALRFRARAKDERQRAAYERTRAVRKDASSLARGLAERLIPLNGLPVRVGDVCAPAKVLLGDQPDCWPSVSVVADAYMPATLCRFEVVPTPKGGVTIEAGGVAVSLDDAAEMALLAVEDALDDGGDE